MTFPSRENLVVCFGHPAYRVKAAFDAFDTGIKGFEVTTSDEFERRIAEADVVVVSGFWKNNLLAKAPRLKFIQSISAGINQYDLEVLKAGGVRLASAQGVNMNAVSDHAMSLILSMSRRLPEARDNQAKKFWRPMQSDHALREDELAGKTLLIFGMGRIGGRLAKLAKAFDMNVIGLRRSDLSNKGHADEVHASSKFHEILPRADFVALTCALTDETRNIIGEAALSRFKATSYLINMARGACVDEQALIQALRNGTIKGAALDCTVDEPLPEASPLWSMSNVFI
ncbi:MAG TPA: D-2-hydroxyacid dehydrogenase, partial [Bradyrhizobium sp.]|uniref:D-2-hydroxyacid dehydrogenase n=1 Tax=Bradyrhizobium sp. TaxID=376 RepID=UPI002D7E3A6F